MIKLSEHFTVNEFEQSDYAARHDLVNSMDKGQTESACHLCESLLEKVRTHFDAPVIISSGYRCPELNTKIGGSVASQHMFGEAADIKVVGYSAFDVAYYIAYESGLDFDQVIHEFGSWTHISTTIRYANRGDILTITKQGTEKGIK